MRLIIPMLAALIATGCTRAPALEQILERGELRVVMLRGTAPFYEDDTGPRGLEHDLAERFAERLGVTLQPLVVDSETQMVKMLLSGKAHVATAGLAVTEARRRQLRFGPTYQEEHPVLVYRVGSRKPKNLADLGDGKLAVSAPDGHHEQLVVLRDRHPGLIWQVAEETPTLDLLRQVNDGELEFAIAYAHELDLYRHQLTDLREAFKLGDPAPFAWALPPTIDDSLQDEISAFFAELDGNGELVRVIERYFGHLRDFDYVDIRTFQRRIGDRLPRFATLFEQAAGDDIDWRMLAAIGYQESHWNRRAKSPTGVRGIMMLTLDTAAQVGVENRLDASQSIHGGAAYLRWVRKRIPERIREPDRTWMALATYNIGFGHLEDARILAQQRGGDADRWSDVRDALPLLEQKRWYSQTKRGFARGREAVTYVENIRTYHDILVRREYLEQRAAITRSTLLPTFTPLAL